MAKTWFDIEPPYCEYGRAKVIIIPAPYEGTVSWGKGASKGPAAIFEASPYIEFYNPILDSEPYLTGIHGVEPLRFPDDPEKAVLAVKTAVVRELETGRHPMVIGGEHSLTAGAVKACLEAYPALTVLQLDAHADLRDSYEGTPFSHACTMRRVAELGADFVQAGVRAVSKEEHDWLDGQGRAVISSRYIRVSEDWTDLVMKKLSDQVYLTIDVDVLDPSEMPATGTPEPGGISYHHLIDLVLALKESGKQVVGADLMELAPIPGLTHPDFLCASLAYTMIGAFFCR